MPAPFEVIEFQAEGHPIELLVVRSFKREADKIFTMEEYSGLLNYVAANPEAGVRIPGTSGLRKIRWRAKGSGKRGGARVVYYFRDLNMPLLMLAAYPKGQVAQLSAARMKEIDRKVEFLVGELACPGSEADLQVGRRA
ncbi:addiction module toxin RelE [Methylobacterium sp. 10]|uniref:addiction module toxin RelE n=1 Tax=Methylobacterium sp. 10 TaxID=1101191 RepID=UPI001FD8857D|nr:addiction module toxin RelE [Methylobacterium sp. 10]